MGEYDGLVTFFPGSKFLLNQSFQTDSDRVWEWYATSNRFLYVQSGLNKLPTTNRLILGTTVNSNDDSGILPYPSILNLYAGGCKNSRTGEVNCTAACGDVKLLFQDWQTRWNCLTLANMAINKPHPHHFNDTNNVGDTAKALDHLAVTNLIEFDAVGVLKRLHDCAGESWSKEEPIRNFSTFANSSHSPDLLRWGTYISQVCRFKSESQNDNDLAGPGVIGSYFVLILLVFYAWACIRILHMARSIDSLARLTIYGGKIYSFITFQRSRLATRLKHSTSVFVIEIQEAQCFFILAIRIGLIYTNIRPTEDFGTDDWSGVIRSRTTMNHLTVIAALTLLLNQVTLHQLQLDSLYSFALCTTVFIMSYVASTASILENMDIDTIYRMSADGDNVKCGGFASLDDLCDGPYFIGTLYEFTPRFVVKMCFTGLCLLWAKKIWKEAAGTLWLRNYAEKVSGTESLMLLYMIQMGRFLTDTFLFAFEIIIVVHMWSNFFMLFGIWDDVGSFDEMNDWPIGQVISALVWAPVVSKYLYLLICELFSMLYICNTQNSLIVYLMLTNHMLTSSWS
ncbi:hypothetical protein J3E68DRAFT_412221 [Trichoderma sp. SZMC 28012]